jgi:hypothetical protein
MITLLLGTSVALKWAFPMANGTLTNHALRPFQRHRDGEVHCIVLDVFWAEIANVLHREARRGRWTRLDAETQRKISLAAVSPPCRLSGCFPKPWPSLFRTTVTLSSV